MFQNAERFLSFKFPDPGQTFRKTGFIVFKLKVMIYSVDRDLRIEQNLEIAGEDFF